MSVQSSVRHSPNKLVHIFFKVFVKGDDGRWRIASWHLSRREAEETADLLGVREGLVARVML